MIYYIAEDIRKRNTAGAKAPDDIVEICRRKGYTEFSMPRFPSQKNKLYQKAWLLTVCTWKWHALEKRLQENDVVIYQHPLYGNRIIEKMVPAIQRAKKAKFIAVIHDLESLRGGITGVVEQSAATAELADNKLLKHFDAVICHNEHMRQYLIGQGFQPERLVNLEIFDYLSDCVRVQPRKGDAPSVAIAGNLASGKCRYIYEICGQDRNTGLTVNLYGNNFDSDSASENMVWHGSFKPEELPEHLTGDFGLVWDGESAETCAGNTGNYLRYNNPHKTSLYLSSGMPVIVWSQAAIADFVLENGVGITIDNLAELENRIGYVTVEEYQQMCERIRTISARLHSGYYFSSALDCAVQQLKNR